MQYEFDWLDDVVWHLKRGPVIVSGLKLIATTRTGLGVSDACRILTRRLAGEHRIVREVHHKEIEGTGKVFLEWRAS